MPRKVSTCGAAHFYVKDKRRHFHAGPLAATSCSCCGAPAQRNKSSGDTTARTILIVLDVRNRVDVDKLSVSPNHHQGRKRMYRVFLTQVVKSAKATYWQGQQAHRTAASSASRSVLCTAAHRSVAAKSAKSSSFSLHPFGRCNGMPTHGRFFNSTKKASSETRGGLTWMTSNSVCVRDKAEMLPNNSHHY